MPDVGDKVLMNSGIVGEVTMVNYTGTQEVEVLYDIQSGDRKWRMPAECFTFPVPDNVTPMFSEPLTIRRERAVKTRTELEALARRLRGDYDGDE